MSIDYDRLRELARIAGGGRSVRDYATEYDAERELENLAPGLAQELLRLRDELGDLRDTMHAHADRTNGESFLVSADYAHRITQVLQGETE